MVTHNKSYARASWPTMRQFFCCCSFCIMDDNSKCFSIISALQGCAYKSSHEIKLYLECLTCAGWSVLFGISYELRTLFGINSPCFCVFLSTFILCVQLTTSYRVLSVVMYMILLDWGTVCIIGTFFKFALYSQTRNTENIVAIALLCFHFKEITAQSIGRRHTLYYYGASG